jgi:hypothetical protein
MRLFPFIISLLAILSFMIPSVLAVGFPWSPDNSAAFTVPTVKPISFDSYEEAFAIPTVKPISFGSYAEAFAIPKLKPISFDSYEEAFAIPTIKHISIFG